MNIRSSSNEGASVRFIPSLAPTCIALAIDLHTYGHMDSRKLADVLESALTDD